MNRPNRPLTSSELILNCLIIENIVRENVLRGIESNFELINVVNKFYHPRTPLEQEMYSEAIIYARLGVLN